MTHSIDVKICSCGKIHNLRHLTETKEWKEYGITLFQCDACKSHMSVKTKILRALLLENASAIEMSEKEAA